MSAYSERQTIPAARTCGGLILDLLFPPVCLVCDRPLLAPESRKLCYSNVVCAECAPELSSSTTANSDVPHCSICTEPEGIYGLRESRCLPCILAPLYVEKVLSVWPYAGQTEELIKRFKYGRRRALSAYLAQSISPLIRAGANGGTDSNLLVAVPSPGSSLRARGFSHLGMLLRSISRELGIPYDILALRSVRGRQPQAGLSLMARAANVRGSYIARHRRISGKRIILIDDVLTTGASLAAAAKALRNAGATEILAVTLARSPRFQKNRLKAFLHVPSR